MTDDMTLAEADAYRRGWEAGRNAAVQFHERMAEAQAPGTGNAARHQWFASSIRALSPPARPARTRIGILGEG